MQCGIKETLNMWDVQIVSNVQLLTQCNNPTLSNLKTCHCFTAGAWQVLKIKGPSDLLVLWIWYHRVVAIDRVFTYGGSSGCSGCRGGGSHCGCWLPVWTVGTLCRTVLAINILIEWCSCILVSLLSWVISPHLKRNFVKILPWPNASITYYIHEQRLHIQHFYFMYSSQAEKTPPLKLNKRMKD